MISSLIELLVRLWQNEEVEGSALPQSRPNAGLKWFTLLIAIVIIIAIVGLLGWYLAA